MTSQQPNRQHILKRSEEKDPTLHLYMKLSQRVTQHDDRERQRRNDQGRSSSKDTVKYPHAGDQPRSQMKHQTIGRR